MPQPRPDAKASAARCCLLPLALSLVLASAACGGRAPATGPISPAEITRLESRVARDAGDHYAMLRLGAAYRQVGRLADARTVLECALELDRAHPATLLALGAVNEDLGRYTAALELYQQYMTVGQSREVKRQLEKRFPSLHRRSLQEQVRNALAQEAELAQTQPEPRTVGVFPFHWRGADPTFEPLGRALAEMVATDLAQVDRITVLERVQVQLLLDEIELGAGGLVDESTAARSGRLLGAGRIVNGWMVGGEDLFQLSAAVVDVGPAPRVDPVTREDALERLFDMQKDLVFSLFDRMGIALTATETQRINQRPTQSLQALLSFGQGLEAMDEGDFERAVRHFNEAARLDPDFGAARRTARSAEAAAEAEAEGVSTEQLVDAGMAESPPDGSVTATETMVPTNRPREPTSEVLGTEGGFGRQPHIIDLIFRRP